MRNGMAPPGADPAAVHAGRSDMFGWRSLSRASRRLVLVGGWILVGALVALALMVWQLRRDALADASAGVGTLGLVIAEQASRTVQAGDLVLEDLRQHIEAQRFDTVDEFKAGLATPELFRSLKDRADFLPQVDVFAVVAADGTLVNHSRGWPTRRANLADRDYLAWLATHGNADVFVSPPQLNRVSGSWTSFVARRVTSTSGTYMGVVVAGLDLQYFRDFFRTVARRAGTTVSLSHRNGAVLASYPTSARAGQPVPGLPFWPRLIETGPAVLEVSDAAGAQVVAVNPLPDYPLVVSIGRSRAAVLANWTHIALVTAVCTAAAAACILLLIRAQVVQFRRLERTEAALRQQADELSAGRAALAGQSGLLETALRHMNQGIVMVNGQGRVVVHNGRMAAMLDLPLPLLARRPLFNDLIAHQQNLNEFTDPSAAVRAGSFERVAQTTRAYERVRPNGTVLEILTVPLPDGGFVRTYTDVTERRRAVLQARYLARHDPLTGLLNRAAFHEEFAALLDTANRANTRLAVLYLDLDGFKPINDTHGHAAGDGLLTEVAHRLRASTRESDVVARMGGDEFAIVQPFTGPTGDGTELAGRLVAAMAEPFGIGTVRCAVGLSVGVALYPDHAASAAELLGSADVALYRAKTGGKNMACVFDPALDRGQQSLLALEQDLAQAIARNQLHLEYQPIVDASTLAVVRFEALLRWRHPERGTVPPSEFIPVAERSGLIVPIGLWALEQACTTAGTWAVPAEVSVNLSPVQFARGDLAAQVQSVLQRTGLAPWRLNLEVTEGVLLDHSAQVLQAMAHLRSLGIRFSLDDFGAGHAGLTYLRRFSFDVLKIDKVFVQAAAQDPQARTILGAIRTIGAACRLAVVAEGVETEAELALVRDLWCDHVQGYLTGRPAAEAAFIPSAEARPPPPRLSLVQS